LRHSTTQVGTKYRGYSRNAICTGTLYCGHIEAQSYGFRLRRMSLLFSKTTKWNSYDFFARQKMDSFRSSKLAVIEIATKYKDLMKQLKKKPSDQSPDDLEKAEKLLFVEMCEICLWGNKTDLSLLTNFSHEDMQKLQGSKARRDAEANILVNDLGAAFDILRRAQRLNEAGERRVDIVLDNAGFELYVDLVLGGFLLSAGLATHIVLHPKSIPWFVSDVIPADFGALLNVLADPRSLFDTNDEDSGPDEKQERLSDDDVADLKFLYEDWQTKYVEGQFIIRPNRFWTMGGGFWRLPTEAPELLKDLRESELVIFKGDLNYRKLTGDVMWDPSTLFSEAVGPLAKKGEGIRVLALRTAKADVIVGLPHGKDEELRAKEGGGGDSGCRKWAWSGTWAVCQFSDGL